jgi:hypothetical protein
MAEAYLEDEDHARQNPEACPHGSVLEVISRNKIIQYSLQNPT